MPVFMRYGVPFRPEPKEIGSSSDNLPPDGSPLLSVGETDICLAKALRELAGKRQWGEIEMMTIRTLALSAAYRLEKLAARKD